MRIQSRLAMVSMSVIVLAALSACGGGGGGGSSDNGGSSTSSAPSSSTANANQSSCSTTATYATGTVGAWVMAIRGNTGTATADRGAVCQNTVLDTVATNLTSTSTVAQAASSASTLGFTGTIIDVAYATSTSIDRCAETLNYKMKSLLVQGRLTDVGIYSSDDGNGTITCSAVAGTKAGAGEYGQLPVTHATSYAHPYEDSTGSYNYPHDADSSTVSYVDVNLSSATVADSCYNGGSCLPSLVSVTVSDGYGQQHNVLSIAGEATSYSTTTAPTSTSVDTSFSKYNSTIRYYIDAGCGASGSQCTLSLVYNDNGVQKTYQTTWSDNSR